MCEKICLEMIFAKECDLHTSIGNTVTERSGDNKQIVIPVLSSPWTQHELKLKAHPRLNS